MKKRIVLPAAYGVLVAVSLLWMWQHASETPFAGIFAVSLTIPWSLVGIFALALISRGTFDSSLVPGAIVVGLGALINSVILFFFGRQLDRNLERTRGGI